MSVSTLSHNFTIFSPNRYAIAIIFGHSLPLFYLAGPFLFFYTRNALANTTQLSKADYLHFLPFIISLISIFPYYFVDFDTKLKIAQLIIEQPSYLLKVNFSWLYPSKINLLLRPIILSGYALYCILILGRYIAKEKKVPSINQQEKTILKWLLFINSIIALIAIIYSRFTILFYINPDMPVREISRTSIFTNLLGLLFFLIPVVLLTFPQILYGFEKFKKNTTHKKELYKGDHAFSEMKTASILEVVKKEENLLNPDFGIDEISKILNIDKQEVLYCFNVILNKKYITLRKELRVDLAKKELSSGQLLSHSMEGIWLKAGFTSKTSFFVAFKEVTGMTPLQYSKSFENTPTTDL